MLYKKSTLTGFIVLVLISPILISWGMFGHEHINRAAVFALPVEIKKFFYNHIDFVTQESTVPDLRKYTLNDKSENPRHFIDLENFKDIDTFPANLAEAEKQFDKKFLDKNGVLPWYIVEVTEKLTRAFKEKRKTEILFLASDLGHYIGDAHMPLHTSVNHDGQLTDQRGIHAFFEAQLPEMFGGNYNYYTREARYINDLNTETWRIVKESHTLVDSLLAVDKELRKKLTSEKIYKLDAQGSIRRNKFKQPVFTTEYAKLYHEYSKGMIERQIKKAISATSDYWYTAWVNAGKPDLTDLDPPALTKRNEKFLQEESEMWKKGRLFGIESEKEF